MHALTHALAPVLFYGAIFWIGMVIGHVLARCIAKGLANAHAQRDYDPEFDPDLDAYVYDEEETRREEEGI